MFDSLKPIYWEARTWPKRLFFKSPPPPKRWEVTPPEVNALEAQWWADFAELEEELAWVQPPDIRRRLRKHYLQKIIRDVPPDGTIVDFGCGSGWLAILLAELGAKRVIGVENAPPQIALAERAARLAGVGSRVNFTSTVDDAALRGADTIILHGVLHHMAWQEIDELFDLLYRALKPEARICIFEPVAGRRTYFPWSIPLAAIRLSALCRRQSPEETRLRRELNRRGDGPRYPGHGVSPKEMPFRLGEIDQRLSGNFQVSLAEPVFFNSIWVAMEFLLLQVTHPQFGTFCLHYLLPLYGAWERLSLFFAPKELWNGWVFCLYRARPASLRP